MTSGCPFRITIERSEFRSWCTPTSNAFWRRGRTRERVPRAGAFISITRLSAWDYSYDETASSYKWYRGIDCISWFVNELYYLAHRAKQIISTMIPMARLTPEEIENYYDEMFCHVCGRPFGPEDQRVRDHCHMTGRYRGPAHSRCNLWYRDTHVIPIFFHNVSGYNAHFIIKEVANAFSGSVELLPLTKEVYISFTKNVGDTAYIRDDGSRGRCVKLRFVDSFKFLATSLDKLASYLDKDKLQVMRSEFKQLNEESFELLTRKGIFPYV